jgi:hypothetical protein
MYTAKSPSNPSSHLLAVAHRYMRSHGGRKRGSKLEESIYQQAYVAWTVKDGGDVGDTGLVLGQTGITVQTEREGDNMLARAL